jgi:hypothetical protein
MEKFQTQTETAIEIDFVRELQLRQWARQHFVPGELRKQTWHPIVLNEMKNRDRELAESHLGTAR